jgi:ABC-type branched-subunit amino acid transport system ATPase component
MTYAIQVEDLSKHFGCPGTGVLAVDHISFEVRQGEVFGFLGPNGASKTTTQPGAHHAPGADRGAHRHPRRGAADWTPQAVGRLGDQPEAIQPVHGAAVVHVLRYPAV